MTLKELEKEIAEYALYAGKQSLERKKLVRQIERLNARIDALEAAGTLLIGCHNLDDLPACQSPKFVKVREVLA